MGEHRESTGNSETDKNKNRDQNNQCENNETDQNKNRDKNKQCENNETDKSPTVTC